MSDMSFDETGDLLGDSRRPGMNVTGPGANKRRSSHRFEAAQKRRKSKSIGTKLEGDEMLKVFLLLWRNCKLFFLLES